MKYLPTLLIGVVLTSICLSSVSSASAQADDGKEVKLVDVLKSKASVAEK